MKFHHDHCFQQISYLDKVEQYSSLSLQNHADGIYDILKNNHDFLPEHAKRFYGYMTERNILFHYSSIEGIQTVLTHLSNRIRNRFELQLAIPILEANYQEIEEEFFIFFKDLQAFCKEQPELNGL